MEEVINMAQKVIGKKSSLNPGSATVTHKTMGVKSNVKGVPEVPVMQPTTIGKDTGNVSSKKLPNHKNVGTHH